MAKDWKEQLCYSTPAFSEHTVNGRTHKFYPLSMGLLFEFRRSGIKAVSAVTDFFASVDRDNKRTENVRTEGAAIDRTVVCEPITLAMAEYRDKQRVNAIGSLIEAITDAETQTLLARIVIDSMREVFPEDDPANPKPEELLKVTKLPTLVQMVVGVAKANKDTFGFLAPMASGFLARLGKLADLKVDELTAARENLEKKAV